MGRGEGADRDAPGMGFDLHKLNKFAKGQVLDPLVEEEKRLAQNLREGLSTLLDMHNPAELGSLCGALGLVEECEFGTHGEKKAGVMRRVALEGARHGSTEKAHMDCLAMMWDGILFEYLRAEGMPLRSARIDPRVFTLQLWRKRAAFNSGGNVVFRPHYVPRHIRRRGKGAPRAADLEGILRGVEAKELAVKHVENKIRKESDYRNVIRFLADTTSLHEFERDARDYLMHELEAARDRIDHYNMSLEMTAEQLGELELKHERCAEVLVSQIARTEAELHFSMELNAIEPATEEQQIVRVLRYFLATPGPGDGTMTLRGCPVELPSLDEDLGEDPEEDEWDPWLVSEDFGTGKLGDEEEEGEQQSNEDAPDLTPEELKLQAEEEEERRAFAFFVAEETRKAKLENERRRSVRTTVAVRCPLAHQREPAVLAKMAFDRHARDVAFMLRRCEASEAAFAASYAWYDDREAHCAAQMARAARAERRCQFLNTQISMLIDAAAHAAAQPFSELNLYQNMATRALTDAAESERKRLAVAPTLGAMVRSDDGVVQVLGAVLSVALGLLPSRAAALEQMEAATMAREELSQRTIYALTAPTPKVSDKKKKGGKKGKKGGKKKGGKKGGKKKGDKKAKGGDKKPKAAAAAKKPAKGGAKKKKKK
ncbi:poly(A)-specific ribonuclease [Aureococcus anophagefferens]|uniref:Poly(A)-specific ribonuclease n=1 Tax=Aureococcus anophagefferens TaxID=44056 RepID=A0ABR1GE09_AURAN